MAAGKRTYTVMARLTTLLLPFSRVEKVDKVVFPRRGGCKKGCHQGDARFPFTGARGRNFPIFPLFPTGQAEGVLSPVHACPNQALPATRGDHCAEASTTVRPLPFFQCCEPPMKAMTTGTSYQKTYRYLL